MKVQFIEKYLIFVGLHSKGTQFVKFPQNSKIRFPKITEIWAKSNERQGKNKFLLSKMSAQVQFLIFLDYIQYSPRKVTMKSMHQDIYPGAS